MKYRDKATLYRELAKLIEGAMHLDRSFELLLAQKAHRSRHQYVSGLRRGVSEGLGLAESVRKYNAEFTTGLEVALIEAGERSGKLGMSFNHLARYFAAMDGAGQKARQAMIYPLLLAHLAVFLPELPALIVAQEDDHPVRRMLIGLGILWVVILASVWLWRALSRWATTSAGIDVWLNRIPFIGPARRHWALARFCQVSHACMLASVSMFEIVRLAGLASQSGVLKQSSERAAMAIMEGERFGTSLANSGGFDNDFVNALSTAEEVGKIDEELARWSTNETLAAHESVDRAAQWLPKAGYLIVVLFVLWRILGMVQGIYGEQLKLLSE
ncbi:MAG: type II secretion system F family protein [Verrucomicrobiota bacterium]